MFSTCWSGDGRVVGEGGFCPTSLVERAAAVLSSLVAACILLLEGKKKDLIRVLLFQVAPVVGRRSLPYY